MSKILELKKLNLNKKQVCWLLKKLNLNIKIVLDEYELELKVQQELKLELEKHKSDKIKKNLIIKEIKTLNNLKMFNNTDMDTVMDTNNDTNINTNINTENNLTVIFPELKDIIDKNDYVFSCISNKKKDFNSLSYLIEKDLSQSDCIKLGIGIEKVFKDIIIAGNTNLENIKPINKKGQKEKDHLFKDETTKTIYYAEIKSNLNLDTEKCKSTSDKCLQIKEELKIEFPDYEIKMFLVGIRYYEKTIIPKIISNKYLSITDNLFGINDYLSIMNSNIKFENEKIYIHFLNYLSSKMFNY